PRPHRLRSVHRAARARVQPHRGPHVRGGRSESEDRQMSLTETATLAVVDEEARRLPRELSPDQLARRRFYRNPTAVIGLIVLTTIVLASVLAPLISPYDP